MGGRGSLIGFLSRVATTQLDGETAMQDKLIALATGANQGIGL